MKHKLYTAWISVDDLLPYEDGWYLVVFNTRERKRCAVGCEYYSNEQWTNIRFLHISRDDFITHWMALPSPPGNTERGDG